jgi:hypothetical protein
MTDKFMSGWGRAKGMINKMVVICDDYDQAYLIRKNAKKRSEMKHVNIRESVPYYGNHILASWSTFEELGEIWKAI